jgi:predicted RNA polymerase sigma factor
VTLAPGPMVALNRIVALSMVRGPEVGLHALGRAETSLGGHQRIAAVRAHLLEMAGQLDAACEQYREAAGSTMNLAERRYLEGRAAGLSRLIRIEGVVAA